jgi:small subunit ribosomal protein S17
VKKLAEKKQEARNIGLNVKAPEESCKDKNCPFHGILPVRGQVITGIVLSSKMQDTILVKREYMSYVPKYERYEKRTSKYSAHCSPCIKVKAGDQVKIAECRPLSKTTSFVTIEKL